MPGTLTQLRKKHNDLRRDIARLRFLGQILVSLGRSLSDFEPGIRIRSAELADFEKNILEEEAGRMLLEGVIGKLLDSVMGGRNSASMMRLKLARDRLLRRLARRDLVLDRHSRKVVGAGSQR